MTYPVKTGSTDTAIDNTIIILAEQGPHYLPVISERQTLRHHFSVSPDDRDVADKAEK